MIPLWSDITLVLNSHRISVAANVTFITFFPLFLLCLWWSAEAERRGERGTVIWLSFTSGALSLQQAVLSSLSHLFSFFFFPSRRPEPFSVQQAQFCRLIFTLCIVLPSTLSVGTRTSQKPVVKWLRVCYAQWIVRVCVCIARVYTLMLICTHKRNWSGCILMQTVQKF